MHRVAHQKGFRCIGQIGVVEAALLYIMLREHRPSRTIEIGALCGTSTRWILAALHANGRGHLTTYDLHSYTPEFISAAVPDLAQNWTFVKGDAISKLAESTTRFDADLLFIDALHRNSFAQLYTQRLLRKAAAHISKPLPMFVHDIFSPFMMPQLKPCQQNVTFQTLDAELACIRRVVNQQTARGMDVIYGEKQPAGEGIELMSWLARTGRANGLVTFSVYAAPYLARAVAQALRRPVHAGANDPSIFFQLIPDSWSLRAGHSVE